MCGGEHAADTWHFPVVIRDKKTDKPLGYICRKCCRKEIKREERGKQITESSTTTPRTPRVNQD